MNICGRKGYGIYMTNKEKNTSTPQKVLKKLPAIPNCLEVKTAEDATGAAYFVKGAIFAFGGRARITVEPL